MKTRRFSTQLSLKYLDDFQQHNILMTFINQDVPKDEMRASRELRSIIIWIIRINCLINSCYIFRIRMIINGNSSIYTSIYSNPVYPRVTIDCFESFMFNDKNIEYAFVWSKSHSALNNISWGDPATMKWKTRIAGYQNDFLVFLAADIWCVKVLRNR